MLKWYLHQLAHYLRDRNVKGEELAIEKKGLSKTQTEDSFLTFCNEICNYSRAYFRELIKDNTVECAIRLADKHTDDPSDQNIFYCTAGRSQGFNPGRDEASEPIPANRGVPCFFLRQKCHGVLIYHDLKKSADNGTFIITENEKRYHNDLKTLMVAPINGWTGKHKSMIGLLYVTSKGNPFRVKHVDSMRLIADMLAKAIPRIVDIYFDNRLKLIKK